MKVGTTQYLICNHCGGINAHTPLIEANARYTDLWSDGYADSPMAPAQTLIALCGACRQHLWLPELAQSKEATNAVSFIGIQLKQLIGLIDDYANQSSEHHLYLRLKLWRELNHPLRQGDEDKTHHKLRQENMLLTLQLLDMSSPQEQLIAIEMLRQLKRFEESGKLIELYRLNQLEEIIIQLIRRVESKDSNLFRINLVSR